MTHIYLVLNMVLNISLGVSFCFVACFPCNFWELKEAVAAHFGRMLDQSNLIEKNK